MAKNKMCDLRDHLFETLERLKSNNDPEADTSEKIDVETAKQISNVAGKLIETYKVEVLALNVLSHSNNPKFVKEGLMNSGLMSSENKQLGE